MPKMSLDEFKDAMKNDYIARCDAQEITIKELHAKLRHLETALIEERKLTDTLMNRCIATTGVWLCGHCDCYDRCRGKRNEQNN